MSRSRFVNPFRSSSYTSHLGLVLIISSNTFWAAGVSTGFACSTFSQGSGTYFELPRPLNPPLPWLLFRPPLRPPPLPFEYGLWFEFWPPPDLCCFGGVFDAVLLAYFMKEVGESLLILVVSPFWSLLSALSGLTIQSLPSPPGVAVIYLRLLRYFVIHGFSSARLLTNFTPSPCTVSQ